MTNWRAAVIRVFAGNPRDADTRFLGSAFLVAPRRLLTCRHVVDIEDKRALFVSGPAWTGPQKVSQHQFDDSRDVALLSVPDDLDLLTSPLQLWTRPPGVDLRHYAITLGGYSTSAGPLETPQVTLRSYDGSLDTWVLHTHISKGLSGGPATIDGRVVGITQAREVDGGKTYIIPIAATKTFLSRNGIYLIDVASLTHLHQAPRPPTDFVGREEVISKLTEDLTASTAGRKTLALKGLGGVGKTTVARALCWEERIVTAFPDGILWTTLGESPDALANLHELLLPLQTVTTQYETAAKASAQLKSLLANKQCLLVVDDAWKFEDLEPFLVVGHLGAILLTTRDSIIARNADATVIELDVLSPETSRAYLRSRLTEHLSDIPSADQLDHLAALLQYLPLALEIASIHLRDGMEFTLLLNELSSEIGRLRALEITTDRKDDRRLSLDATLALSIKRLPPKILRFFALLGLLRQQANVTPVILSIVSGETPFDSQKALAFLTGKSLLTRIEEGDGEQKAAYRMHDLIRDKSREMLPTIVPSLTGSDSLIIVDRVKVYKQSGSWSQLATDAYLSKNLSYHLTEANDLNSLFELLEEDEHSIDDVSVFNAWLLSAERMGWPNQFLSDCDMAWSQAESEALKGLGGKKLSAQTVLQIAQCIRAACITTSVISQNSQLTTPLVALLMENKIWTPTQALYAVGRSLRPGDLVDFVATLPEPARTQGMDLVLSRLKHAYNRASEPVEVSNAKRAIVRLIFQAPVRIREAGKLIVRRTAPESKFFTPAAESDDQLIRELLLELKTLTWTRISLFETALGILLSKAIKRKPKRYAILGLRRAGTDHTVWLKALSDLLESYLWLTCKRNHLHKSMDTLQHSMEGIEDDAATLLMDGYATFVAVLDAKLVIEAFDRSLDFLIGQNAQEELEFAYQDENRRRERQAALDAYARAIRVLVQCAPACDSERIGRAAALLISLNRSYRPQTDNLAVLACALSDPQRLRLASTLRQQGQVDDGQITLLLQLAMRMQSLEDRKAQYAGAIEFLKTSEHRTKEWFVIQIAKEHMASLDEPSLTHLAELLLTYRYSRALVTAVLPSFRRLTAFMRNAVYEKVFAAGDAYGRFIIGCAFHGEANALNSASLISELLTFIRALWPSTLAIEAVTEVFAHVTVPKAAGVAFLETALELARGIHDYESVTHSFARTAAYADDQERSPLLIAPPICTGVLGIVLRESEMRKSVFVKLREVWKSRLPDRPVRSKSRSITELPSELLHDVKDAQLAKKLLEMLRETVDLETRSVLFSFIADYGQEFSLRGYRTIALEAAFAMHDCYRWWP